MTCTGRCAGDSSSITSGTRPPAIAGWRSRPNSSCTRIDELRPFLGLVVDRHRRARTARRNASAPRRRAGGAGSRAAGRAAPSASSSAPSVGERGLAGQRRREPVRRASRPAPRRTGRAIRRLRRGAGTCTRSRHCRSDLRPRQPVEAEPRDALAPACARSRRSARPCIGLLGERDRAEPAQLRRRAGSRSRRRTRSRRGSRCGRRNRASISASVIGAASRMRPCAARAGDLGDREKRLARQRRGRIDVRAAAVGEQERAAARRGSWRCGRDRRARAARRASESPCSLRASAGASPLRSPPIASPSRAHPARGASGRGAARRGDGARSTSLPPSPRSVSTSGDLGRERACARAPPHRPPCGRAAAAAAAGAAACPPR